MKVEGLCEHCGYCVCCCQENKCFGVKEISQLNKMLKTKQDVKIFLTLLTNSED